MQRSEFLAFLFIFIPIILGCIYVFIDLKKRKDPIEKEEDFIEDKKLDPNRFDVKIAKIIRKEIENDNYNDVIWLKALKNARGKKDEARALYIEYRTEELERVYYNNDSKDQQLKKVTSSKDVSFGNKFLSGQESLAVAFWLYTFLGNLVVGIIIGMISVLAGLWVVIILIAYSIFSLIGLWACADAYTNKMQRQKKSYGWAIAAKVFSLINLVTIFGQIILMVGNK